MDAVRVHPHPDGTLPSETQPAPASALVLDHDIPIPSPGPGELLIRVQAASVTRDELLWPELYRDASGAPMANPIPGNDFAGVIAALGPVPSTEPAAAPSASAPKVGDAVFGRTHTARGAVWATYAIALPSEIAPLPATLSPSEAASVPTSALTAWQALFVHAALPEPSSTPAAPTIAAATTVLVTGATGAVGLFAVQLAALAGLRVLAATSRAEDPVTVTLLRSLGAHVIVPYGAPSCADAADVVIGTVGGAPLAWGRAEAVRPGGRLVSVATSAADFVAAHAARGVGRAKPDVMTKFFIVESDAAQLAEVGRLLGEGRLGAFVAREFEMGEAARAYEVGNGRSGGVGKVVLTMP